MDKTWAADLVDMSAFSRENKGYKFILSIIDIFSKYGWLVPLKDKKGTTVRDAFQSVFKSRVPEKLWTDKGTEFYNKEVKKLLKNHGVELYSTENEEKSSVVERWNRTMKEKMFKYFSANSTRAYLPVLDNLVRQYNSTKHSSTKMTPTSRQPEGSTRPKYTGTSMGIFLLCDSLDSEWVTKCESPRRRVNSKRDTHPAGLRKCSDFPSTSHSATNLSPQGFQR